MQKLDVNKVVEYLKVFTKFSQVRFLGIFDTLSVKPTGTIVQNILSFLFVSGLVIIGPILTGLIYIQENKEQKRKDNRK